MLVNTEGDLRTAYGAHPNIQLQGPGTMFLDTSKAFLSEDSPITISFPTPLATSLLIIYIFNTQPIIYKSRLYKNKQKLTLRRMKRGLETLEPLKLIPYHTLFSKYLRLKYYREDSTDDTAFWAYLEDLASSTKLKQFRYSKPDSSSTDNIFKGRKKNHKYDDDSDYEAYKSQRIPKNHKTCKLRTIPYHSPFSRPAYLKAGYVQDRFQQTLNSDPYVPQYKPGVNMRRTGQVGRLPTIPYHPLFSKPKALPSGYVDDGHEVIIVVKTTTSSITKRFRV